MERNEIKELLREVAGPNIELKDTGKWVSTHCIFASWRHEKGTDTNMSFGVMENPHGDSVFNCFACKAAGRLSKMLRMLEEYTGEDYSHLIDEVSDNEALGGSIPEWKNRKAGSKKPRLGEPLDPELLDIYDPAIGHPYVKSRGISDESARLMELKVDVDNEGVERILFPVYHKSNLYGFTSRAVPSKARLRIKDYFGLPKRNLLLGMQLLQPDDRHIVLVEGLFDYARLVEYGYPVLAVMHSGITDMQAKILKDIGLPVYMMFDRDKAGRDGVQLAKKVLYGLPLLKVRYPDRMVFDKALGKERLVKDPGELYEDEVASMVEDARLL